MDKQNLFLGGGAAGAVIIPQAAASAFPQIFSLTPRVAPYCSGSCGACGGLCLTGVYALLWLVACVGKKAYSEKLVGKI